MNNVLIHLHNYTADRYRCGGYIVLLLGEKWVWGLGWNRGWINLLECCQGGIPCYCKCNSFCAFVSNIVVLETKTGREGFEDG